MPKQRLKGISIRAFDAPDDDSECNKNGHTWVKCTGEELREWGISKQVWVKCTGQVKERKRCTVCGLMVVDCLPGHPLLTTEDEPSNVVSLTKEKKKHQRELLFEKLRKSGFLE